MREMIIRHHGCLFSATSLNKSSLSSVYGLRFASASRSQTLIDPVPKDIGIMKCYIPPTGLNLPSWSSPVARLKLSLKKILHSYIMSTLMVTYFKQKVKPRKINFTRVKAKAVELHEQMNAAFAAGRTREIESICAANLARSLTTKVNARPKQAPSLQWSLQQLLEAPRIVAFQVSRHPMDSNKVIAQTVVRVRSKQSVVQVGANGKPLTHTRKEFESLEYPVIQYRSWTEPAQWYLCGTAQETPAEARKIRAEKTVENSKSKTLQGEHA